MALSYADAHLRGDSVIFGQDGVNADLRDDVLLDRVLEKRGWR